MFILQVLTQPIEKPIIMQSFFFLIFFYKNYNENSQPDP